MALRAAPPVIFLGPSCPAADARSVLPDALILPPVSRGDLYRYRILNYSLFVIVDGVFVGTPAISPREVVDVLADGAMVVGASSMGALRAADCAPAGAVGIGEIFRLYRRRILSSEDEVAVLFAEELPFPPATEPLANMRIALRRAARNGILTAAEAARVVSAAQSLHYSARTWKRAFEHAGVYLTEHAAKFLSSVDAKRADARKAFRWIAARLASGSIRPGSPRAGCGTFGLDVEGRERLPDPLDGAEREQIIADLARWLAVSGWRGELTGLDQENLVRAADNDGEMDAFLAGGHLDSVWSSGDFEAALVQFGIHRRAVREADRHGLLPRAHELTLAERAICVSHDMPSWYDLTDHYKAYPGFCRRLDQYRATLAVTLCLKRQLFPVEESPDGNSVANCVWQRI